MDDVTVLVQSPEELLKNLEMVFESIKRAGMVLKPEKCEFCKTETKILNHLVSFRKIHPNQVKKEEAKKLKVPKT
ncbi:13754_t:CDS:1, partial [Ambispora leptoticha]